MFNPFLCGSGTFNPEDDNDEAACSPSSTPRRSRRGHNRDGKNPYSSRGLDKFSSLLVDLEEKRQQIYSQVGSQDISFVRFAYSTSNDCVPIVVKLRDKKQDNIKENNATPNSAEVVRDKFPIEPAADAKEFKQSSLGEENNTKNKCFFSWRMELGDWRRPSYYLPAVIILILLLLTVFGRSVVILCISMIWYLVPIIEGGSSSAKKPTKKKAYLRGKSEIKVVSEGSSSPKVHDCGRSPRQHGHRRSW